MSVDDTAVARYRETGLYYPHRFLTEQRAAQLRRELEDYEASSGGVVRDKFRYKSHLVFPWINEVMREPGILDVVEAFLGPDLMVWSSHLYPKEPGDGRFISWHQDSAHWGLDSSRILTVWIALTPANEENGCMRMLPGSQREGQVEHEDTWDRNNILTRGQQITAPIDEAAAVWVSLAPGEGSIHHVDMWHASKPNDSSDRRIGLALRYITPDARQTRVGHDFATLVRGEDRYQHFEPEPRCTQIMDPVMIALHERIAAVQGSIYLKGTGRAGTEGLVETSDLND